MINYIKKSKDNVQKYSDKLTLDTNTLTVDLYNTMTDVASKVKVVLDKVAVMGDMLTDLRILNGSAKTIVPLSELPIVSNTGLDITNDVIQLSLSSSTTKEIDAYSSSIITSLPYKITTKEDVTSELEYLYKSDTPTKVSFDTGSYSFSLAIPLSDRDQLNCINLKLNKDTETYPIINSIKYVDEDNNLVDVPILNTENKSMDLNDGRVKDNLYNISISTIITDQLLLEFVCKDGSSVTFDSIKTIFNRRVSNGSVVLGPYVSDTPILKVGINSEAITKGCSFSISGDADNWIDITNSSSYSSGSKKILSFNTISDNSIKLEEDLYRVYVKVDVASSKVTNESSMIDIYKTYREDGTISSDIMSAIPNNLLSAYRIKSSDFIYGKYHYNNTAILSKVDLNNIEVLDLNGIPKVLGMESTNYSISNNFNSEAGSGSIGMELKALRLPSSDVISASSFDVSNSNLVDIDLREINESINISYKDNLCMNTSVKEDVYTLVSSDTKKYVHIDITTPFIKNSSAAIIQVPNEDIIIRNSIGQDILKVDKSKLIYNKTIDLYFLSLVGILFKPLSVEGLTYSTLYPIKELDDNEFALNNGKIVCNGGTIINYSGYEFIKTNVSFNKVVNYTNGNYLKRTDTAYTYHHEQVLDEYTPVTVLKLDNVSIERGSIQIEDISLNSKSIIRYSISDISVYRKDKQSPYGVIVKLSDGTVLNDCDLKLETTYPTDIVTKDKLRYAIYNNKPITLTAKLYYKGEEVSFKEVQLDPITGWSNTGFIDDSVFGEQSNSGEISCEGATDSISLSGDQSTLDAITDISINEFKFNSIKDIPPGAVSITTNNEFITITNLSKLKLKIRLDNYKTNNTALNKNTTLSITGSKVSLCLSSSSTPDSLYTPIDSVSFQESLTDTTLVIESNGKQSFFIMNDFLNKEQATQLGTVDGVEVQLISAPDSTSALSLKNTEESDKAVNLTLLTNTGAVKEELKSSLAKIKKHTILYFRSKYSSTSVLTASMDLKVKDTKYTVEYRYKDNSYILNTGESANNLIRISIDDSDIMSIIAMNNDTYISNLKFSNAVVEPYFSDLNLKPEEDGSYSIKLDKYYMDNIPNSYFETMCKGVTECSIQSNTDIYITCTVDYTRNKTIKIVADGETHSINDTFTDISYKAIYNTETSKYILSFYNHYKDYLTINFSFSDKDGGINENPGIPMSNKNYTVYVADNNYSAVLDKNAPVEVPKGTEIPAGNVVYCTNPVESYKTKVDSDGVYYMSLSGYEINGKVYNVEDKDLPSILKTEVINIDGDRYIQYKNLTSNNMKITTILSDTSMYTPETFCLAPAVS